MDAIGRLAGGIAHDFNNLLTAIGGHAELLLLELEEGSSERESAEQIVDASTRAAGLTRQLLTFSRKQVIEPKVLELNEVVANAEKLLRSLIGENIELLCLAGPLVRRVRADRNQLDQVILNLAVNARDAMPNGGTLTIETRHAAPDDPRLYAAGIPTGAYSVLVVSDTGVGMDEQTRSRIFEPFFTTKETGKGTGLGLATVHGIVEQSGGHVAIQSSPGNGTSFEIYLPTVSDPVDGQESVEPLVHLPGAETLLLVEDEEVVRRLVHAVLERTGYEVLVATDVRDAIHICEEHEGTIDLMVTDVAMPDLNGCELAAIVADLRPAMKVLFMSGYLDDAVVQLGVGDGVPFLQKPFTHDTLVRKVSEVLDGPKDADRREPVAAAG
jgi:two-component system cell cycle sensor histidine kinase/response regulator CckA